MIAIDCETDGVDLYHAARPFFVTTCDSEGNQRWWEWDVDPMTRVPAIPAEDRLTVEAVVWGRGADELLDDLPRSVSDDERAFRRAIRQDPGDDSNVLVYRDWLKERSLEVQLAPVEAWLSERHRDLVGQNLKFDVTALRSVGIDGEWPWHRTQDTLVAGHLLASNQPHNLTDMAIAYLGVDINRYEDALKEATQAARRWVRSRYPNWFIAGEERPGMPSATKETWKYDTWLPRAVCLHENRPASDPWWTVLRDYANADSAVTIALWRAMRREIERRGQWALYRESMRLPEITIAMESRGVTMSGEEADKTRERFEERSKELGRECTSLAADMGHVLDLPRNGVNNNLRTFFFDVMKVERIYSKKAKSAAPTLDKAAMSHYAATLEGPPGDFVKALLAKRKADTALNYLSQYQRFAQPFAYRSSNLPIESTERDWYVLHPNLNQTGTDTLRGSSNNPNEQNIFKGEDGLRRVFGPAPGREWWSLDFKNLELRLMAYRAGVKVLIDLFDHPDEPPYYGSNHMLNFHTVYPDLWAEALAMIGGDETKVAKKIKEIWESTWYQYDKNGWFAIQYGAGKETADRTFRRSGSHAKLSARLGELLGPNGLNERTIAFARKHGYVETFPDRSVDPDRGYPLMVTRTEYGDVLPTVPLNYMIQGTACWVMRRAKVKVFEQLREWRAQGFDGHIVLDVHDEMVLDLPKGRNGDPAKPWKANLPKVRRVQMLMESCGDDVGVPTPVSIEYHAVNWQDGLAV